MLSRYFEELRRRRVPEALGLYLAGGWISFEVADSTFVRLGLPDWTVTFVLALIIAGIPIAVAVAWFFDFKGGALHATPSAQSAGQTIPQASGSGLQRRRSAVLAGAGIVGIVLAGAALWVSRDTSPPPLIVDNSMVVFPFTVRGGDEAGVLGEGMVGLLSRMLDGVGNLRTVDPNTVLGTVSGEMGPATGRDLAREFGAAYYLLGSVLEFGGSLNLEASVYSTEDGGESLATAAVEGLVDSFPDLVDQLASQLLVNGDLAPSGTLPRTAVLTTSEYPALKFFVDGERALRNRRFEDALALYDHAIEADSAFALAHYRKALAAAWLERPDLGSQAIASALRFQDRLSQRDRDRLIAYDARRLGRTAEAEERYRTILASYPTDAEAWYELGEVVMHGRQVLGSPLSEAREPFERAAELDPGHMLALDHLSNIAVWTRDSTALDTLLRRMEAQLDSGLPLILEAQRAFMLGDSAAKVRILDSIEETQSHVGVIYGGWSTDEVGDMRSLASTAVDFPSSGFDWIIASQLAGFGLRDEALDWIEMRESGQSTAPARTALLATQRYLRTPPDRLESLHARILAWDAGPVRQSPLVEADRRSLVIIAPQLRVYLLGLIDQLLGRTDRALKRADELDAMGGAEEVRLLAADLARHLRADVELMAGRPAGALAIIEQLSAWETFRWDSRFSMLFGLAAPTALRADALFALDRHREAIRWYRSVSLAPHTFGYESYRRALAHEALGEAEQAKKLYSDFIHRWKEADPELQELVEDARQRLEALETS